MKSRKQKSKSKEVEKETQEYHEDPNTSDKNFLEDASLLNILR